jgi:hypothetical protein
MSSPITVIIPTSPIPIHPSTEIIEKVIHSIRHQLPEAQIWILIDGVREQMKHRAGQYKEYVRRLMNLADEDIILLPFAKHLQQAGMLKIAISEISTPLLLFCEHDAVLDDKPIAWDKIENLLLSEEAYLVRLYWNSVPHPEHLAFFGDRSGEFIKTTQYSGWPHIARVDFYKRVLREYFSGNDKQMLESALYGPCCGMPWEVFKMWVYCPDGDGVRFHHLNARVDPVTGEKDFGDW